MNETINLAVEAVSSTASAWYAAVPFRIVMIVVALLLCFAGYKLMRGVSGLFGLSCGFAGGAVLTALLPLPDTVWIELTVSVILMVILGVVFGALFYRFYRAGFFLLSAAFGAMIGYLPAMFVWDTSTAAAYAVMIVFAVIFGVAGAVIDRPAVIVLTSFFGFGAAFPLLALLQQNDALLQLGAGAVLTIIGMLVQFLTNRGDSKPLGTKKLKQQEEESEQLEDEDELAQQPIMQEKLDPEDEIDSISDVVAAHLGITEPPMTNPFGYTERADEPEKVSDSTQLIDLSKHEGETKTTVFSGESIETVQLEDTTEEDEFAITLAGLKPVSAQENEEIELQETRVDIPKAQPEEVPAAEQQEEPVPPIAPEQTAVTAEESEAASEAIEEQPEAVEESEQPEISEPAEEAQDNTCVIDIAADTADEVEPTKQTEEQPVSQDTAVCPPVEAEEATESEQEQMEPVEQDEQPEKPKKKHRFTLRLLLPILLLAASVVFASLHVQMAEVTFLLIFLCYIVKYYRVTAFACLILCVRSGLDVYIQYMQGDVQDVLTNAVSAVVFLIIGIICVWTSAAQKKEE